MKYNVLDVAITILGIIYVPFLFSFIPFSWLLNNGKFIVVYILAGAWITDTFAYFIGKAFGKHKLSKISPKKTIEGCIGGIVGATLFFGIYSYYLNNIGIESNWVIMTFVGIISSIISQIGDIAASSIKRFCDVKDFGTIMPGHGGVLDRFDSVIFIAPFIFMLFQFII